MSHLAYPSAPILVHLCTAYSINSDATFITSKYPNNPSQADKLSKYSSSSSSSSGPYASPPVKHAATGQNFPSIVSSGIGLGGGFVAYVYDPDEDDPNADDEDDEDWLNDPLVARLWTGITPSIVSKSGLELDVDLEAGKDCHEVDSSAKNDPISLPFENRQRRQEIITEPSPPLTLSWRAISNLMTLVVLVMALLGLFIVYSVVEGIRR
jgi:hypothetical protein